MVTKLESEIRNRIDAFVQELSGLVREAALEAVHQALGTGTSGPGRATAAPVRRKKKGKRKASRGGRRGGRRSPEEVESMGASLLDFIRANPGLRLEEISAATGTASQELKQPISRLLAGRELRTEGKARGTRYYPSGGGGRSTKKRTGKKKRKGARKKKSTRQPAAATA